MRLALCHIPGCQDTAGSRGFMCVDHWALVPKGLKLRHQAACRAFRRHVKNGAPPPEHVWPHRTGTECIEYVLLLLWVHFFPVPESCERWLPERCCLCPLCSQARRAAPIAYGWRRFINTRARLIPPESVASSGA